MVGRHRLVSGWHGSTDKAVDVTGLRSSTEYQFAIRANSPNGELSEHSNIVAIKTSLGTPGSPNDLHRGQVGTNWFDILWNDNAIDEAHFEVWVKPPNGSFQLSENVAANGEKAHIEYGAAAAPDSNPTPSTRCE